MAGQGMQNGLESSVPTPLLKSSVAGLVGRISVQQVFPGSSRAEYPQDPIEHVAGISPGPSPPIRSALWLRKKRLDELPLFFGEVHAIPLRGGPVMTAREFVLRGSA